MRDAPNFNVADDAQALREAMKGLGTDEDTIINILTSRSSAQRQEIVKYFTNELGRVQYCSKLYQIVDLLKKLQDLIEDLKSELSGNFEDVIVALCCSTEVYLCKELHKAMDGIGTNEHTLIEILCTKENDEVQTLVDTYESCKFH